MNDKKHIQLSLFSVGEGDLRVKPMRERKTEDLLARATECQTLVRSNRSQFLLYFDRLPAFEKALAGIGKDKWVKIGADFMPTDIAKLIVKFIKNYASTQCGLIAEMRLIQAELKKRKVGFVFSDEVYPQGGC